MWLDGLRVLSLCLCSPVDRGELRRGHLPGHPMQIVSPRGGFCLPSAHSRLGMTWKSSVLKGFGVDAQPFNSGAASAPAMAAGRSSVVRPGSLGCYGAASAPVVPAGRAPTVNGC